MRLSNAQQGAADDASGYRGGVRVTIVVPAEPPRLFPAVAAELLALLLDAHRKLVAERRDKRSEAA